MATPKRHSATAARRLQMALLVAFGCGATACAAPARNPFAPAGTRDTQLYLRVENHGFNDVHLYTVSSHGARSVGVVEGNTQRNIAVEWRQLEQISFRIEVLAGRTYTTPAVTASPGDQVELIIPDDPSGTYVRLR
jgi:hypothetical protein